MKIETSARFASERQRVLLWWQGRSTREQALLAILAGLASLWIFSILVVEPLWTARQEAIANIRTYDDLSVRLRQAGTLGGPRVAQRSGSPATILTTSAAERGLAPVITSDAAGYRVVLADVPYEMLIRWIADVERSSSLRIITSRIDRQPTPGFVSAQLTVRG